MDIPPPPPPANRDVSVFLWISRWSRFYLGFVCSSTMIWQSDARNTRDDSSLLERRDVQSGKHTSADFQLSFFERDVYLFDLVRCLRMALTLQYCYCMMIWGNQTNRKKKECCRSILKKCRPVALVEPRQSSVPEQKSEDEDS